jgi:hypothetical protein
MAVDLMGCYAPRRADDQLAIQEAAAAGLRSLELLVSSLSAAAPSTKAHQPQQPFGEIADQAVSKFRKVISILDRTGHARFRRGPVEPPPAPKAAPPPPAPPAAAPVTVVAPVSVAAPSLPQKSLTLDFTKPNLVSMSAATTSVTSTSFFSSVTGGEGSVSKGRSLMSAGKPPLSGHKRKPCAGGHSEANTTGSRCHCSKRRCAETATKIQNSSSLFSNPFSNCRLFGLCRKNRVKTTIRVPAVSSKIADIPADEYSWRKYGQKPIKGSPYPR